MIYKPCKQNSAVLKPLLNEEHHSLLSEREIAAGASEDIQGKGFWGGEGRLPCPGSGQRGEACKEGDAILLTVLPSPFLCRIP